MVVYKVFYKNFKLRKGKFVGMLIERRKNMRGKTPIESNPLIKRERIITKHFP